MPYLFEPDSFTPVAFVQNDEIYHYHTDHLGTPQDITNAQGNIVWSARYRAYGNLALADVEEVENNLRFQGQYFDEETGLHYNRFRYYDPNCGRFINQDPIGLMGGLNCYQYVPNPVQWVDPFGLTAAKEDPTRAANSYLKSQEPITTPSRLLESPKWATPEMEGRPIISTVSQDGLILEQAIDASYQIDKVTGKVKPGGFFTEPDTITGLDYLRNELAVTHAMKEQATHVAKFRFPQGVRLQNSTVGSQVDVDGRLLPGGGPQSEILNYSDRGNIELIELRELE